MAKILVVTGRLAEPIVRKVLSETRTVHSVDIAVLPIDVAAFLTTEYIARYLSKLGVRGYDYIIIPGLSKGSGRVVEKATNIKTVKGTVDAYDLVEILKMQDLSILSPDEPADTILENIAIENSKKILKLIEDSLEKRGSIVVKRLRIPINPPPIRIAAKILHASTQPVEAVIKKALGYIDKGADIAVLCFNDSNPSPDKVKELVKLVGKEIDIPIAIEPRSPMEVDAAIEAGADIVLGIDLSSIDKISRVAKDVGIVVIPKKPADDSIPADPMERLEILSKTVAKAIEKGFEKVMANAVIESFPALFKSLQVFHMFKQRHPSIPLYMDIGEVVESVDADSIGVNATMIMIAQEIGVSIVSTFEESVKSIGSVLEAKIASQMVGIAIYRGSPPRDLGISLLALKDKKRFDHPFDEKYNDLVEASDENKPYRLDPMGVFKIRVDHEHGYIEALYIGRKGRILIRGRSAKAIRQEIAEKGLVSEVSHALYLGQELAKAEIALITGKSYVQEMPLFTKPRYIEIE